VLSAYLDVLAVRSFPELKDRDADYADEFINQLRKYATIPVLSMESATLHPLQSLTDLFTIQERWKKSQKPKVVLTWAPHIKPLPQSVPNSFAQWMNKADVDFHITHPEGFELAEKFVGNANIEYNQQKALENADFVYVKNWSSYQKYGVIGKGLDDWMISQNSLKKAPNANVMHCLPVRRNVVIADDVLDSKQSIVIEQAANRVPAAQAVLKLLLEGSHQ
jgi:N-succinyl-L-ornithine transcarbamylase